MDEPRRLVIDLDGTICTQTYDGSYSSAEPIVDVIAAVNRLWTSGWDVTIFTARGMRTLHGDVQAVDHMYRPTTERWLEENRVCYNRLIFGKPPGDVYVDDRGMDIAKFLAGEVDRLPRPSVGDRTTS